MRRIEILSLATIVLAAFCVAGISSAREKGGDKVEIKLSAVPTVKTHANGEATFVLAKDGGTIHYKLKVGKLENATMAHIHQVGDDGTPAAILAWIYPTKGEAPSLKKGKFSGTLAEGSLTAENLAGPMKGKTPKDVFEMLEYGKAGVAVHTEQNGGGELWGVAKQKKMGKDK
ncbi:MAG: CHRD domain-containing protein [Candidatus Deferrimicrobiaceae bacterium]